MGLITGVLLLPLAPIRATVWLAERIQEQAELEQYDESAIQAALLELDAARDAGLIEEEELVEAENALIERLMAIRGLGEEEGHGGVQR